VRTAIETTLGTLHGRDAIYLDQLSQEADRLVLAGEINSNLCSGASAPDQWIQYRLEFARLVALKVWELELYPAETLVESSFDLVEDSKWAEALGVSDLSHFVVSTYDYVYEVLASDFELVTGGVRGRSTAPPV